MESIQAMSGTMPTYHHQTNYFPCASAERDGAKTKLRKRSKI